ncbi:MAG: hypothetical protein J5594_05430 [Elusimicrobiaceae bacterium]|nr:hypothetical protein [Elusimicrobiaceae bacterium]
MLSLNKLANSKFGIVDSVQVYLEIIFHLSVPIIKTALLAAVFILLGQTVLSFIPSNTAINIIFWLWVGFIFSISTASFFKTSEDMVLNKSAQIYANIEKALVLSVKLFAVIALILGTLTVLIAPMFFIKNPLFALPYRALVSIFLIAVIPFVYFAPLAVALREANIIDSFRFSFYMVVQRWKNISKSILCQIIFTMMIAFWIYFIVSLMFFPNSGDFFDFIFAHATALEEQNRNLYVRFIVWEIMQIIIFTFVSGTFIGINTILFLYLDGSVSKILQKENTVKIKRTEAKTITDAKFVDMLEKSKPVNIDTKNEEEEIHHKTRKEVLNEIYSDYAEDGYSYKKKKKSPSPDDDVTIMEDNYPDR